MSDWYLITEGYGSNFCFSCKKKLSVNLSFVRGVHVCPHCGTPNILWSGEKGHLSIDIPKTPSGYLELINYVLSLEEATMTYKELKRLAILPCKENIETYSLSYFLEETIYLELEFALSPRVIWKVFRTNTDAYGIFFQSMTWYPPFSFEKREHIVWGSYGKKQVSAFEIKPALSETTIVPAKAAPP